MNTEEQKRKLKHVAFSLYCNSRLQECGADALVNRWQRVDELAKVLVALTATGSAVSGWTLWQQGPFRSIWAVIACFTAALAIVHTALGAAARVGHWGRVKQHFVNLRLDLEGFATRMVIDVKVSFEDLRRQLMIYRERYKQGLELIHNDILYTSRLGKKIRKGLSKQLRKTRDSAQLDVPSWGGIDIFVLGLREVADALGEAADKAGAHRAPKQEGAEGKPNGDATSGASEDGEV